MNDFVEDQHKKERSMPGHILLKILPILLAFLTHGLFWENYAYCFKSMLSEKGVVRVNSPSNLIKEVFSGESNGMRIRNYAEYVFFNKVKQRIEFNEISESIPVYGSWFYQARARYYLFPTIVMPRSLEEKPDSGSHLMVTPTVAPSDILWLKKKTVDVELEHLGKFFLFSYKE